MDVLELLIMTKLPSSHSKINFRLRFLDVLTAALAPLVAVALRNPEVFTREQYSGTVFSMVAFVTTLAFFVYFRVGNDIARFFAPSDVQRILKASIAASAMTAAILFVATRLEGIPRSLPLIHLGVLFLGLVGHRALVRVILGRQWAHAYKGRENIENILVVGAGELAWFYARAVGSLAFVRQKIIGLIDVERGNRGRTLAGHTILGSCARLDEIVAELAVHGVQIERIIVAEPLAGPGSPHWEALSNVSAARGIPVDFLPEKLALPGLEGLIETNRTMRDAALQEGDLGESYFEPSHASSNSISHARERFYFRFRRWLDVTASTVLIILLLPLFLVTGLLVFFSFGSPLLFWQERMGRFGKPIHVHKFRSMRAPFDSQGRPLNDFERETRIGRFLRASRLDELPQLFDILRGDMSFIGPRPLLPVDQPPDPRKRLSVRPGLTGWAQVHGGKIITPVEKGALDEWYIDNANLMVDFRICLLTLRSVVKGDQRDSKMVANALNACGISDHSLDAAVSTAEYAYAQPGDEKYRNTAYGKAAEASKTRSRETATSTAETSLER
jgi:lipopolysaccharide/colanic/teichoic acid biosynthesis glycosyltransferase